MIEKVSYVALTICALVLAGLQVSRATAPTPVEVGDRAPKMEMEYVDGVSETSVDSRPAGDALVVFFSTTCQFCLESMPALEEIGAERCDLDLVIAVIDLDGPAARTWWSEQGWDVTRGCGKTRVTSYARDGRYGVTSTPKFVRVRDDRVTHIELGLIKEIPAWLD